jgi:L-aspartate oxidase
MHGANRLASNSLLEAVVFSERGARAALAAAESLGVPASAPAWSGGPAGTVPEGVVIDYNWDVVRRLMWDYVGIVRTERRLLLARERMSAIRSEVSEYLAKCPANADLVELRNICLVGDLIVRSALERKESRGLHFIEDYPARDDARFLRDTVLMDDPVV